MNNSVEKKLWDLNFEVSVSTRYHEWRRSALTRASSLVKMVSIIGAFLAFAAATNWFSILLGFTAVTWIAIASVGVAFVNIVALVFDIDGKVNKHTDLYRRFKEMQVRIARGQDDAIKHIADWEADVQAIRLDEPPVLWGVYARAWNQAVESRGLDKGMQRKIPLSKLALLNYFYFSPVDFPLVSESSAASRVSASSSG